METFFHKGFVISSPARKGDSSSAKAPPPKTRSETPNETPGAPEATPQTPETFWQLIRPHVYPHRFKLILAVLLNLLPGIGIAIQTVAPKYLLDEILVPAGLTMETRYVRLGILILTWLFSAYLLRMTAWYFSYTLFTNIRERVVMDLRSRFFRHINHLCLTFHGRHSSGELFSYVLGSPIASLSGFAHNIIMNVPNAASAFLLSSIWIFTWDWALTGVLLVMVVATAFVMKSSQGDLGRLHEEFQATESEITGKVSDIFRGNRDVKMHAMEDRLAESFEDGANTLRQKTCARDVHMHHVNMRHEAVGYFFFAIVLGLGSWRFLSGHITSGELLAYLGAYGALQGPVGLMFNLGTAGAEARASTKRLVKLLNTNSTTPDPQKKSATRPPGKAAFKISCLSFAYNEDAVLRDLDFEVPFGQRIALVGPSGSGKSTLVRLLMRLYDPTRGAITLGGVDLRDCYSTDVRRMFGIVPQEPYFFRASIRENLQIVHSQAEEPRLKAVCELANAWEFIVKLPQGLDTVIGEGGCLLSGGQRQRLAIARALLHEPDYFIFDEATSALDSINERLVQEALERVLAGRTAFFIAHRLSTIRECDRILVLDKQQIVQDGTFEELASRPGLFREMVQRDQF